ncbi:MAG: hypothetical protein ACLRZG_07645 [Streptococcus sp.]
MLNTMEFVCGCRGIGAGIYANKEIRYKVAYEFNPAMQETYKKNHLGSSCISAMLERANYNEIKEKYGDIDVFVIRRTTFAQGFLMQIEAKNHAISQNNSW